LKYEGVKGVCESIFEVQGRVRKKVVKRPKNTEKEQQNGKFYSEYRRGKKLR
jgi:hypothetical protein